MSRSRRVVGVDPVETIADVAQKNFNRWKSCRKMCGNVLSPASRDDKDAPEKDEKS